MGIHERDKWRREQALGTGEPLCERCDGTGNEFVGTGKAYWPCAQCRGTGLQPKVRK